MFILSNNKKKLNLSTSWNKFIIMFIRDNICLSSRTSCLGYIVKSNESWFIVIFKFVIELWDICYNAVSIWHHQINHILKWNKIKMLSIFFYLGVQQTWNTKYVLSNIECKWVVEVNIVCWEIVEVYQARSEVVNNGTENETTSEGAREIRYGDVTVAWDNSLDPNMKSLHTPDFHDKRSNYSHLCSTNTWGK